MKKTVLFAFLLVLAVMITACGGSGGVVTTNPGETIKSSEPAIKPTATVTSVPTATATQVPAGSAGLSPEP